MRPQAAACAPGSASDAASAISVRTNDAAPPPAVIHRGGGGGAQRRVEFSDDHVPPAGREPLGDRATKSASGAGDDGNADVQARPPASTPATNRALPRQTRRAAPRSGACPAPAIVTSRACGIRSAIVFRKRRADDRVVLAAHDQRRYRDRQQPRQRVGCGDHVGDVAIPAGRARRMLRAISANTSVRCAGAAISRARSPARPATRLPIVAIRDPAVQVSRRKHRAAQGRIGQHQPSDQVRMPASERHAASAPNETPTTCAGPDDSAASSSATA